MPAVVRIKRRIDEEPHSAFLLNGKRRRLLNDEHAPAASAEPIAENKEAQNQVLLKFAGTLERQDDCATRQFAAARMNKTIAKELVSQTSDPAKASTLRRDKQRQEQQQLTRERRYRVVNCLRTTLNDVEEEQEEENGGTAAGCSNSNQVQSKTDSRQITIVDIESQQREQEPHLPLLDQQPVDSDVGYVYDLYVPENELQAQYVDMFDDNYLSLRPVNEVFYEDCYNDDEDYDSEDSNQENYYTNDYPDDDDAGAMGSDEELCQQMNRFMFDDDDDEFASGSSDAEDHNEYYDPYVHTIDTESASFVDDVDFFNAERGSAYERYKRRILREAEGLASSSEDSDADEADAYYETASE
ncbi:hypothetical protein AWZ03_012812 [Drosophila navojoa]|uniref:Probable RNA polymerase II nuclear localization protein SLC7A6OS n=1 Tax=Drosophila navojoa TaxID=7232 RepID=A0A484AYV9_DRONA|nr:probable RNA polymerase II nuclear localization protein SLC7A6OS isoform X1 [Drosophila navojoa]TDG40765.1 hypothetical protein AWZ03_012812 [Drosophila navojoa]